MESPNWHVSWSYRVQILIEATGTDECRRRPRGNPGVYYAESLGKYDRENAAWPIDERTQNRRTRIAIILPPAGQIPDDVKFYVTVCRHRSWLVEAFTQVAKAVEWPGAITGAKNADTDDG